MTKGREKAETASFLRSQGFDWEAAASQSGFRSVVTARSAVSRLPKWDLHHALNKERTRKMRAIYRGRRKKQIQVAWSAQMETDLANLWSRPDQKADMIARILSLQYDVSLTRDAVIGKARRMKLPPRLPTRFQTKRFYDDRGAGEIDARAGGGHEGPSLLWPSD